MNAEKHFHSGWRIGLLTVGAAAVALVVYLLPSTRATTEGPFYEGKTVTYIVATNAGGGYDAYARHIGTYLEKYLSVENVVVSNVPGAGHLVGASTLWRSKADGLTIGTFNAGLVYKQLIDGESVPFDLREFEWIGKASAEPRAIVTSKSCAIKGFEDLLRAEEPVKFGSAGIGSASYNDTMLLAEALDLNIEIIAGFGGTEGEMSMMRGEICAILGSASSLLNFVEAGHGSYIVSIGGELEGVPRAMDFATTESAKRLISFIGKLAQLGRVTAAPPGTPEGRLDKMRAAYKASLEDPQFMAEAKRMAQPIAPAYGQEVQQLVLDLLSQPPETVAIIENAILGGAHRG